jgi:DNA topoisomerase IB
MMNLWKSVSSYLSCLHCVGELVLTIYGLHLVVYVCRWEEEPKEEGVKWKTLEHKGPVFAPAYEPMPDGVKFYYDGKVMKLSEGAEEVAGFYARMLDHDYTTRELFNNNFFKDWRKVIQA